MPDRDPRRQRCAWQDIYRRAQPPRLHSAVTGFNVVLDRILPVTRDFLASPPITDPALFALRSRLLHSMHTCTAEEWFVADRGLFETCSRAFDGQGDLVIGGQAGIAAVSLASLEAPRVFCIAKSMGPRTAEILGKNGVGVPDSMQRDAPSPDTIHLIFEYPPGLVPVGEGVVPRNNRFIVSPVHDPGSVGFPECPKDSPVAGLSRCTRAFLSGYQYLHLEEEFTAAANEIRAIKARNGRLRVHVECVSATDARVIRGFLRHILPAADSCGMNEYELLLLLRSLHPNERRYGSQRPLPPLDLAEGALDLARHCGLPRLHLHTFGYYLLVLRGDRATFPVSLNALLFASQTAARAAGGRSAAVSLVGLRALEEIDRAFGPRESCGIYSAGRHTVIAIPALIAEMVKRTTGLGDILSSTAFVADEF